MSEIWNYLIEHSAELLTGAGMILAVLLGKPKTAAKIKAKAEKTAAKKAAKAQKLLEKAGKLTEELKEEKKE